MSFLKIQAYVWVQVAKSSPERHYFPNWNFMLKTRTILIVTCQPGISLLWSSSSYKIFNEKNIIFQIGILCRKTKEKNISLKRNCLISRINPKLPDYVRVQVPKIFNVKNIIFQIGILCWIRERCSSIRANLDFHYYVQVQVTRCTTWRTLNSKLEFYAKDKKNDDKLFFWLELFDV